MLNIDVVDCVFVCCLNELFPLQIAVDFCRNSRKTFDTSETSKEFGPIKIDFGKVCGTLF